MATQIRRQRPSRFVAFQTEHTLKAYAADPVLLTGYPPRRAKPNRQGQTAF